LFIGRLLEQEAPNFQGLAWFVKEVWPKVRARLPDAELSVVGHVREQRDELISAGINIAGPVDDLTPFYNAARVFVAPIRFAAGVPTKIVEASAVGLPTVATTLMAAQLGWQHGRQIMASDEAIAMADACVTLNQDEAVWSAVRAEAQQAVEQEHGLAEFRRKVGEILDPGQAEAGRAEAISSRLLTKAAGLD
jgi:glycosyltransferase involved in cell wall biosynthesis